MLTRAVSIVRNGKDEVVANPTNAELQAQVAELTQKLQEQETEIAQLKSAKGGRKIMGQACDWLRERDIRGGKLSATQAMVVCTLAKAGKPITPKGIVIRLKGRIVVPATGLDAKLRPAYQSLQLMDLIEFARNGKPGLHYQLTEQGKEILEPIMLDMEGDDPASCFMKADAVIKWFTQEDIDAGDEVTQTQEADAGTTAEAEQEKEASVA